MTKKAGKPDGQRVERMLVRAIARRCRGRTLVLGRNFPLLRERLEAHGLEVLTRSLDDPSDRGRRSAGNEEESFDTVVLCRAVEYESAKGSPSVLREAWSLLGSRGRLLVCVPNEDHDVDPDRRQRFTRRGLKKLLKSIDIEQEIKNNNMAVAVFSSTILLPWSGWSQIRLNSECIVIRY